MARRRGLDGLQLLTEELHESHAERPVRRGSDRGAGGRRAWVGPGHKEGHGWPTKTNTVIEYATTDATTDTGAVEHDVLELATGGGRAGGDDSSHDYGAKLEARWAGAIVRTLAGDALHGKTAG